MLKNIWQCCRISDECVPFQAGVSRIERVCSISGVYVPFQLVSPISGECVPFRAGVSHFRWLCPISGGCIPYWTGVSHFGLFCSISGGWVLILTVSFDYRRFFVFRRFGGENVDGILRLIFEPFLRQNELKVWREVKHLYIFFKKV